MKTRYQACQTTAIRRAYLNITEGSEDQRIDAAIAATRAFFEQMGVPTRLSDYGLDGSSIPALLEKTASARRYETG